MKKNSKKRESSPDVQKAASEFEKAVSSQNLPILQKNPSQEALNQAQKQAKKVLNELDILKRNTIDPIAKGLTALRKQYKDARKPYENLLDDVRAAILRLEEQKTRKALRAAEKKAEKARAKGKEELAEDLVQQAETTKHVDLENVQIRRVWKARVKDASQVPIELNGMMLRPIDEKLLNKLAKDARPDIPGVEWYEEKTAALY